MSEKYTPEQARPREFTQEDLMPFWVKIVDAINSAPDHDNYSLKDEARDSAEASYIQGETGKENLENTHDTEPNTVSFPDFETLFATFSSNEVLSQLLPTEVLREMIEHEKAHFLNAKKHGYDAEIKLTVTRTKEGQIVFAPSVTISVDLEGVDEEKIRRQLKDIAGAPHDDMSESDKSKI